ncbi:dipeptidase [Actinospongicola halichondriae]|uniref:dipeptidase n=1 Tax=Actinospongicola halichondriae TaxID=3236844 RepID=UPI003D4924CE
MDPSLLADADTLLRDPEVDVVDLHLDTYIASRIARRDLQKQHRLGGPLQYRLYGMVDLPSAIDAGMTGGMWSITTNPFRPARARQRAFHRNLRGIQAEFERRPDRADVVRNLTEYRAARDAGRHGAFLAIQGGNAIEHDPSLLDAMPGDLICRITLVHLTDSGIGATSAPSPRRTVAGLTNLGRDYVRRCNAARILVDLAHISRIGFDDALAVHDPDLPPIVTHTGVDAVNEHWRNLTDHQIRAIAERGGTVGIMYQSSFLGEPYWGGRCEAVLDHAQHVIDLVGEDHVSLGSDWDGAIMPPRDLRRPADLPNLVAGMLRRGWTIDRCRKVLGTNALRVIGAVRP